MKNPQIRVEMNRDKISALGLTVNQVETAVSRTMMMNTYSGLMRN